MPNQHSSTEEANKWIAKQRRWLHRERPEIPSETRRFLAQSFADQCFPDDHVYWNAAVRRRLKLNERHAIPKPLGKWFLPRWFVKGFSGPKKKKKVDAKVEV